MYQERTYRKTMGSSRFTSVQLCIQESDLWIGYQGQVDPQALRTEAAGLVRKLRLEILGYEDPRFIPSLVPIESKESATPFLHRMCTAGQIAGVGPMASVAGALAQTVGMHLKAHFSLSEIVVENGGDLYIDVLKPLPVELFAPTSRFSGNLSILVDPKYGPMGMCTSSGVLGHSLSFGKADAVMVACTDAALSDAYATAFCNRVQEAKDVQRVCEELAAKAEVLSAVVVMGSTLAVGGCLEVLD
ncbi:MAG: UPF0280 family protein [Sphaerochaeta sp.]|jgi:hypothetical protein|uniref:UPF0280 family protein n=1 Tax=Sphaerochaeta sp. TaxID=1972642 RepID=UPI003D10FB69